LTLLAEALRMACDKWRVAIEGKISDSPSALSLL
jgi:hypothetical protein